MTHRREQLESALRRAVGGVLAEGLADPRVRGLITVTDVSVTEDRRRATVGISVLPDEQAELTLHGLRAAAGHIQTEVGKRLRARSLPELVFRLDDSIKKQAALLSEIRHAVETDRPDETMTEPDQP